MSDTNREKHIEAMIKAAVGDGTNCDLGTRAALYRMYDALRPLILAEALAPPTAEESGAAMDRYSRETMGDTLRQFVGNRLLCLTATPDPRKEAIMEILKGAMPTRHYLAYAEDRAAQILAKLDELASKKEGSDA